MFVNSFSRQATKPGSRRTSCLIFLKKDGKMIEALNGLYDKGKELNWKLPSNDSK